MREASFLISSLVTGPVCEWVGGVGGGVGFSGAGLRRMLAAGAEEEVEAGASLGWEQGLTVVPG